jgi:hypothetical protein
MVSMAAPMSVTTKLEPASPLWQRLDGTWTQPFRLPGPTSHGAELTYGGHRSRWRPCAQRRPGSVSPATSRAERASLFHRRATSEVATP